MPHFKHRYRNRFTINGWVSKDLSRLVVKIKIAALQYQNRLRDHRIVRALKGVIHRTNQSCRSPQELFWKARNSMQLLPPQNKKGDGTKHGLLNDFSLAGERMDG